MGFPHGDVSYSVYFAGRSRGTDGFDRFAVRQQDDMCLGSIAGLNNTEDLWVVGNR